MGQIKNIKLHIVTDIKFVNNMVKSNIEEEIPSPPLKTEKRKHTPEIVDENGQTVVKTKKKKKSNDTEQPHVTTEDQAADAAPFQKDFYNIHADTEARTTEAVEKYYKNHNITLKGKGKKHFKPLFEFHELGLLKKYMTACKDFDKPTPIQSCCWPIIASGKDIIGIAETGSGKTLAFVLPSLVHVAKRVKREGRKKNGPFMLVVAPTRELAMQSQDVLEVAGKAIGITSVALYGGVAKDKQRRDLCRGVECVVATPGRLIDLMQEEYVDLSEVSYLVLDEADRRLDQGFERDIRAIIGQTHPGRQTALFSATWPDSVRELAHSFLTKPIRVTIGSEDLAAGTRIKQIVEVVEDRAREGKLTQLLKRYHSDRKNRILIFVLYKKEAARIESSLSNKGWRVGSIHGDKSQEGRTQAVEQFKSGTVPLLVAADVAARGLDIPGVDFVINYSFPLTIEDYVPMNT